MLRFTMDVTAADGDSRTIEGLAVPYEGEVAVLNGSRYTFEPGSVALARARTPLLLGHDQSRPVGVLTELADGDGGARMRFSIDPTPDGDAALAQAQSGSRGGLSIGAEIDAYTELEGGVRSVTAARVFEASLVSLSAFESAGVDRVAAELETPTPPEGDPPPDDDQGDPPATEEETVTDSPEAGAPVMLAVHAAARPVLNAGELALTIAGAQRGDSDALTVLAALTESTIPDLTGVLPPAYTSDVLGAKKTPRPLFGVFGGRPLPSTGLSIVKPVWGVTPDGGWIAGNTGDAASNRATIGTTPAEVMGWAWGIAIPYMIATRSSPDVIDAMYSQATEDFYSDVEAQIAMELETNGTEGVGTTIGALIAEFYSANDSTPEVVLAAPDVWGELADAKALDAASGSFGTPISAGGPTLVASFAGLPIVASGKLAPGTVAVATRRAIDARVTNPVKLTVNAIGALNVELGVIGEAMVDTDYAGEILKANDGIAVAKAARGKGSSS